MRTSEFDNFYTEMAVWGYGIFAISLVFIRFLPNDTPGYHFHILMGMTFGVIMAIIATASLLIYLSLSYPTNTPPGGKT